jgi:hypothetical protein
MIETAPTPPTPLAGKLFGGRAISSKLQSHNLSSTQSLTNLAVSNGREAEPSGSPPARLQPRSREKLQSDLELD